MRITVENEGRRFSIPIPSFILFSPLGAKFLKKNSPEDTDIDFSCLSAKDMRKMRRCIRKMRKIHKNWCLVEAIASEGNSVKIRL